MRVNADWTVRGLDQEDTVVHFDTLDGATEIQPSNRVPIYAPRFAAVRKTIGLSEARLRQKGVGVEQPLIAARADDIQQAGTVLQPLQPGRSIGLKSPIVFKDRNSGIEVGSRHFLQGFAGGFATFENLQIIRHGQFDQSEKARLAEGIDAAIVWTEKQAVQVVVDGVEAAVETGSSKLQELDHYDRPPGKPRMRIIKVASRQDALPGETIEFTLRYDNVGDQEVGNVTIIDHLTTRLEYVEGSAQSDRGSEFFATADQADSLILRWEISDPLEPGQGGILRFKCRVR